MSVFIILLVVVIVVFAIKDIRLNLITRPTFKMFKKVLPPLSQTEREAMEAGDVWWDGELFSGEPDWQKLHNYPRPQLSEKETAFIDNQVETLLAMLDDYKIVQKDKDLPKEVWDFLKTEGFFAMIIPEKFGGLLVSLYVFSFGFRAIWIPEKMKISDFGPPTPLSETLWIPSEPPTPGGVQLNTSTLSPVDAYLTV